MGIPVVDALGEKIERDWSRQNYDELAFPDICLGALRSAAVHEALTPDQIVAWALSSPLPQQADPKSKFGQPPITLFRSRRFYVDALFWVDGTTSIHDHGFSGAFQVLSGSSIETTFDFGENRDVGGQLRLGASNVRSTDLLPQGDVRPLTAGPALIHSLFH